MQEFDKRQFDRIVSILSKKISKEVIDIFLIGSSLKNKSNPRDFDVLVFFKEKALKESEEILFEIKESLDFVKNLHIEPIFASSIFTEKIILSIIHEGFSVKNRKFISQSINLDSFSIFAFNLHNLSKLEKVKFAQALYGRKKNGLLYQEGGVSLGQGSFMVPVGKEEIFKEMLDKWKSKYTRKRAFVSN